MGIDFPNHRKHTDDKTNELSIHHCFMFTTVWEIWAVMMGPHRDFRGFSLQKTAIVLI